MRVVSESYQQLRGSPQPTGAIQPYCYYGSDASLLEHLGGMTGIVCGRVADTTPCPMSG